MNVRVTFNLPGGIAGKEWEKVDVTFYGPGIGGRVFKIEANLTGTAAVPFRMNYKFM